MTELKERLVRDADYIEDTLDKLLEKDSLNGGNMAEAMRYATLGGGKRIRAFLAIEFCRLFGGSEADAAYYASAIEMVHAYSLVHDDLPSMDNDTERRGQPTVWAKFGEANAVLAGDALQSLAFQAAAQSPRLAIPTVKLPMNGLRMTVCGSVPQPIAVKSATMKKAIPKLLLQR